MASKPVKKRKLIYRTYVQELVEQPYVLEAKSEEDATEKINKFGIKAPGLLVVESPEFLESGDSKKTRSELIRIQVNAFEFPWTDQRTIEYTPEELENYELDN